MKQYWFRKFWTQCNEGNVFVMVAIAGIAVIGSVGVAVDLGRSQMVQAKLQNSVDAAGLAAGASLNADNLEDIATKYVHVNFDSGNMGATLNPVHTELSEDKKKLTITASASLPTTITRVFHTSDVTVDATTEVTRSNKGLEVALVLDTTGSMGNSGKIEALQASAHDLIDILFGDNETGENLWVGIVPFATSVNIGPSRIHWLDGAYHNTLLWSGTTWAGCVEARFDTGKDITDDPPFDLALPNEPTPASPYQRFLSFYQPYLSSDNDVMWGDHIASNNETLCNKQSSCTCANYGCHGWTANSGNTARRITCTTPATPSNRVCTRTTRTYAASESVGPNRNCPSSVTPLTNVRSTIEDGIDALVARGGTYINYGAVWGWRLISPRWRGYWGGVANDNNLPLNYNAPLMSKAVIIMTDGVNSPTSYSAYAGSNTANSRTELDAKTTQVCNAMKAQGIIVYTILFMEDDDGVKTLLRNCATTPDMFFDSPTAESLNSAFTTIGDSLANLRISK